MESKIRVIKAAVSPKTVLKLFSPFPSLSGVTLQTLEGLQKVESYQASCSELWAQVLNPINDSDAGGVEINSDPRAGVAVVTYTSRSRFKLVPKWDGSWRARSFDLVVEFPTPSKYRADEILTVVLDVASTLEGVELTWEDGSSQVVRVEDEEEIWTRLGVRDSN